jgi:hypothetical protein
VGRALVAAGPAMNLLHLPGIGISASRMATTSALANLHDGRPSVAFEWGAEMNVIDYVAFDFLTDKTVNLISVHGLPRGCTQIRVIATNAAVTLSWNEMTTVIDYPSSYIYFATPIVARWFRVEFTGTMSAIGELVVANALVMRRNPIYPIQWTPYHQAAGSPPHIHGRSDFPRRKLGPFKFKGFTSDYEEARDGIFRTARGPVYPVVFVPDTDDPLVSLGLLSGWTETKLAARGWSWEFALVESPMFVSLP